MAVDLLVGGRWIRELGPAGDLSWVTRWPGGLYQVSWTMTLPEGRRLPGLEPGAAVQLRDGGLSMGWAQLTEPDWSDSDIPGYVTASFNAKGLSEQAAQFLCLDADGVGTSVANTAIDAAGDRGWGVIRAADFSSTALTADTTTDQSNKLPTLLDAVVKELGENWGIDPDRYLVRAPNVTDVMWHVTPGQVDLGVADDNFATDLYVDYINTDTGAGDVEAVHDADAVAMYGGVHKEAIVNAIGLGPITTAQANAIGAGVFAQAQVAMGWTTPMELNSSQILDAGGNPANLDRVAAHQTLRVHGVFDARVRLPYTDIVIGECTRTRGADTVTLSPMGAVGRTLQDVIEQILKDAAAQAFAGSRNNTTGTAILSTGWTGSVVCSREVRTVTIDFDTVRASWAGGSGVATIPAEFCPHQTRYGWVAAKNTAAQVAVLIASWGAIEVVLGSTSTGGGGLTGSITYVI